MVATSFTDQHGEDGVLSFEDTSPHRQQQTMTSREIAELTGKRHADVMRDIRAVMSELHGEEGLSSFASSYLNEQNKQKRGAWPGLDGWSRLKRSPEVIRLLGGTA
ncbi:MAG TPA: Rha family transcriptional regulator, partial [Zoogloea sp.]|nr:Rha family transcriptional regulator [Zoogloea sp.]